MVGQRKEKGTDQEDEETGQGRKKGSGQGAKKTSNNVGQRKEKGTDLGRKRQ